MALFLWAYGGPSISCWKRTAEACLLHGGKKTTFSEETGKAHGYNVTFIPMSPVT